MHDKGADLMQLVHPLLDRASQTSGVRAATLEHAKLVQGTLPATLALPASAGNKQTVRDVRLFHSYLWALALLGQGNEGRVQGSKMLADAAAKIDEPTSGSKRVTPQAAMPPPPPPSARSSPALSEQRGMRSPLMPAPGAGGGELCVITLPDGKQALFHKATNMVVGMLEAPAADSLQHPTTPRPLTATTPSIPTSTPTMPAAQPRSGVDLIEAADEDSSDDDDGEDFFDEDEEVVVGGRKASEPQARTPLAQISPN